MYIGYEHDVNTTQKRWLCIVMNFARQCNKKTNETYRTTNDGERNLLLVKFDSRFRKDIQSSPGQMFKFKVEVEGGKNNSCQNGVFFNAY